MFVICRWNKEITLVLFYKYKYSLFVLLDNVSCFPEEQLMQQSCCLSMGVTNIYLAFSVQGLNDNEDSKNLTMFKAVLKKSRDGGKGSKKESGMCNIRQKPHILYI